MTEIEIIGEKSSKQLFMKDQFIETVKLKDEGFKDDEYNNCLRIYQEQNGTDGNSSFRIQLRAFGNGHPSYKKSTAKPAQYTTSTTLTINEVEEILAFMKKEENKYGYFKEIDGEKVWVKPA